VSDLNSLILKTVTDQKKSSEVLSKSEYPELFAEMRSKCPVPGDEFFEVYRVVVRPGPGIPEHTHREWIVLYYPKPAETAVIVEGERIVPNEGDFLVLPPEVPHAVEHNMGGDIRVSIAMKVVHDGITEIER
jgi:quercetin dioxygenase-like cupin family protein